MSDTLNNAALVLKSLSKSDAARIMSKLEVRDVRAVMQRSDQVSGRTEQELLEVLGQFSSETNAIRQRPDQRSSRNAPIAAKPDQLVQSNVLQRRQNNASNPFCFLIDLPADLQYKLLKDEHPENISLVVTYLPTKVSAELLKLLESPLQISVLRRLCQPINPKEHQVSQLVSSLRSRLEQSLDRMESPKGVQQAAKLLSCSESQSQQTVLDSLDQTNPELVDEIRSTMLSFEDLEHFEALDVQVLLKNVDTSWWAPSLKTASRSVREKIMSNMAPRVAEILSVEIAEIHNVDSESSEKAQSQVIGICIQLAEQGKIELPPKAGKTNAA